MPKVTAAIAALLLLVTLTGCGDREDGNSAPSGEAQAFAATAGTPAPTESVDPLSEADVAFLAYVRADLVPQSTIISDASDESLIAAGRQACEQIKDGVKYEDLRLVEGEEPAPSGSYYDTSSIMNGALVNYCPDLLPPPSEG